ncbi:MAG: RagB/SusD family nutrient uptake outer membrane protein [Bacteroidales bacterium]|nr:RagB/SusD family nutrient uptake outer membrane protein [Bacteroidales bacterium]MBN2762628.1 RagB/SusD family nutrient uptake outer membrane protein [Bacteroidales bacterium]
MKRNIKNIGLTAMMIILASCGEDFLDLTPQDRLTADDFYKNEDEVRAGTASLYGYPWFSFNDKFFWLVGDCMSGNLYYTFDQEGQFYYFSFNEGNTYISYGWKSLFRVISYANSIINDMPRIAELNVSQEVIDQALGEARFFRAAAYYILAEFWGDVPIVENSTELVTGNEMMLPRNTRSSIYEFIRRDLEYAAENLKASDDAGRVTQWSARAMLAKLYITMAQNLNDASSASYFAKAKEYAEDVIVNSGHTLMTDYADLFKIENNNNSESLFALQFMKGGYALGNSRNANWARSSIIADQQWGGGKGTTIDFFKFTIDSLDARRKSICMTLGDYYPEINKADGGYTYNFVTENPDNPDNPLESYNETLNHLKKYVVGSSADTDGKVGTDQDAAINQYMLRLADVYLIYAEAVLGSSYSTSDATALGYFNAIRARGDLDPVSEITWESLLKERRVEFCLESMFWFDIKRYYYRDPQGALDYLNNQKRHYVYRRIEGDNDPNAWDSYMMDTELFDPITVHESQMFLPVPAAEVLVNPLLDQPAVEYQFE